MHYKVRQFLEKVPGTQEKLYKDFFKRAASDTELAPVSLRREGKRGIEKEQIIQEYLQAVAGYAELVKRGAGRNITLSFFNSEGNIHTAPALAKLAKLGYGPETLMRDSRVIQTLRGVLKEELAYRDGIRRRALGQED